MKKKLISFILLIVMISALFPVSAFAEPTVQIYTVQSGDTAYSICARYGVEYDRYKYLIMALNNMSSENQLGALRVGDRLAVPTSSAAAAAIAAVAVPVTGGTTAGTIAPAATPNPVGAASSVLVGDSIGFYIISYTIKSGDTVLGIYNSRGQNYKTYSNMILKLNKLSSFNSLKVGKTILLPVPAVTTGDTVAYTVLKHRMQSGDTVFNIVKTGYGLNYDANQEMLKIINNKDNLASFKVGEYLNIPVQGYLSPSSIGAAGTK